METVGSFSGKGWKASSGTLRVRPRPGGEIVDDMEALTGGSFKYEEESAKKYNIMTIIMYKSENKVDGDGKNEGTRNSIVPAHYIRFPWDNYW